jgi:predicted O-methyltransferase YrrM
VQKQIDWGVDHVSASGLIDPLKSIAPVVGAEIGTCLGMSAELFLKELPSLQTLYCIDHYPSFIDWNGTVMSEERQACMKDHARVRLSAYGDRASLQYMDSQQFEEHFSVTCSREHLDFIFVDGDHSYEGVLRDFQLYWNHIRVGGIFAGHDWNISSVQAAIRDFFPDISKVHQVSNDGWYVIREA